MNKDPVAIHVAMIAVKTDVAVNSDATYAIIVDSPRVAAKSHM